MRKMLFWVGICCVAGALGSWGYVAYQNTVNLKSANESLDRLASGSAPLQSNSWGLPLLCGAGVLLVFVNWPAVRRDEK